MSPVQAHRHLLARKLFLRALPCSLLVTLFSLFGGCESTTQSTDGKFTVSGSTHSIGSTAPLVGVLVNCEGATATSGPDGTYELSGIPPGKHIITADCNGFQSYADSIEVVSSRKYYIYMNLLSASLTGTVTNIIDGTIRSATVRFRGLATTTDSSGRYKLEEIPPATDTLYITHPDYLPYKSLISITPAGQQGDVVLTRIRTVQGSVVEDAFVQESEPNLNFSSNMYLGLSTNGPYMPPLNRRNIYVRFSFPAFFSDYRVTVLSGSLDLCSYTNVLGTYQTNALTSEWSRSTITYNTQPDFGGPLSVGNFALGSIGKYFSVLDLNGVQTLLADWRAKKQLYGVVIQGGGQYSAMYFYSSQSNGPPPRITFTVRY